jgi:hypothetical protein
MERKAWDAWIEQRRNRKGDAFSAVRVLEMARRDAEDYVRIAEQSPDIISSVGGLDKAIEEMRNAVTEVASELDDEGSLEDMGAVQRADLEQRLQAIAADAEARMRQARMSMLDRIGGPKGDLRPLTKRAAPPAPGAHDRYK